MASIVSLYQFGAPVTDSDGDSTDLGDLIVAVDHRQALEFAAQRVADKLAEENGGTLRLLYPTSTAEEIVEDMLDDDTVGSSPMQHLATAGYAYILRLTKPLHQLEPGVIRCGPGNPLVPEQTPNPDDWCSMVKERLKPLVEEALALEASQNG